MNEVIPQITEITKPMCNYISWKIEEDMEQSVEPLCDVAMEVPTVRFDVGQLMQWPDMNSAGVMICEFTLESEMFSHGPTQREAEPVFVTAESEVFTQVFAGGGGGGVVAEAGPLVMVEAVTSRVSALPTVGSDIQTGLSAAVGEEDRWCLSSGDDLDKVGHGTGRSEARMVPVEHLLLFSKVHSVMLSWMRPMVALTSKFFLSDEREKRKECRDRFVGITSGTCPTCEKFIQVNLGRHVALYHLDLAQLWRCPVGWCPVWKGTSQDCVDHMRRAHNTPISVKAGNLARWFPPWTVTREQ